MKHPDDFSDEYTYATAAALNEQIRRGEDSPGMDDLRPLTQDERRQAIRISARVMQRMDTERFGAMWQELGRLATWNAMAEEARGYKN